MVLNNEEMVLEPHGTDVEDRTETLWDSLPTLVQALSSETPPLAPQLVSLVQAFIKYLKEPRYQLPLTLPQLLALFRSFYHDLNSAATTIYTQSNSTKKHLIANCPYFTQNPKEFDYLLSIANYSALSIKLVRRTDPAAVGQLRAFNIYKFLVVMGAIERGQRLLFQSISARDDDGSLYDKIFRFDEKDLVVQEMMDRKLDTFQRVVVPFERFSEGREELAQFLDQSLQAAGTALDLDQALQAAGKALDQTLDPQALALALALARGQKLADQSLTPSGAQELARLMSLLSQLNTVITPSAKLQIIVQFQKSLVALLIKHCHLQPHHINNDTLLPVLIYLFIYKLPKGLDLYLNFEFIRNFVNLVDPYDVEIVGTSYYFYRPGEGRGKRSSLWECTNLAGTSAEGASARDSTNSSTTSTSAGVGARESSNSTSATSATKSGATGTKDGTRRGSSSTTGASTAGTDANAIAYLTSTFLNNSELNYYLTNLEAVLFFIQNVTIDELSGQLDEELLNKPLGSLVEKELASRYQFPKVTLDGTDPGPPSGPLDPRYGPTDRTGQGDQKTGPIGPTGTENRSRSSSLFNTLTTRLNEATKTRSRSNSLVKTRELFPSVNSGSDTESIEGRVDRHDGDGVDASMTFGMMKNLLGRFGSMSVLQLRNEEEGLVRASTSASTSANGSGAGAGSSTTGPSSETIGPSTSNSTTGSGNGGRNLSIGSGRNLSVGSTGPSPFGASASASASPRKNTIASKLSSGVSEIMTKFNTPTPLPHSINNSETSLSVDETNDTSTIIQKRDNRSRTASIQIMEKWFSNISNTQTGPSQHVQNNSNDSVSISHEGSVFSAPNKELTRFQNMDFDSLTVMDLRLLKNYYDQLCNEVNGKYELKSTQELLEGMNEPEPHIKVDDHDI